VGQRHGGEGKIKRTLKRALFLLEIKPGRGDLWIGKHVTRNESIGGKNEGVRHSSAFTYREGSSMRGGKRRSRVELVANDGPGEPSILEVRFID